MAYRTAWAVLAGASFLLGAPALALADTGGSAGAGGAAGKGGSGGSGGASAGSGGAAGKAGSGGGSGGAAGSAGGGGIGPNPGYPVAGKGNPKAIMATPCAEGDPMRCMAAFPLKYSKKVELPIAFDWDTGWIPDGSALQVRFYAKLPAYTKVDMEGGIYATWPKPITVTPFGLRTKGHVEFDYGLQIGSKVKFEVSVLGKDFNWEGDTPFVPKVDFHVKGYKAFDPWAWEPGVLATGYTPKVTLFTVDITDALIPIPGIGGGLSLDLQGEMGVNYTTEKIVVTPTNGTVTPKVDGPVTGPDKAALHEWQQGAWGEYLVHPEGKVKYGGIIHLIPSFYIEILTKKFSIPIYDFEYDISSFVGLDDLSKTPWVFDDELVHVPLPDVRSFGGNRLSFGQVTLGEFKVLEIPINNIGEADAHIDVTVDHPAFKLIDTFDDIKPGKDSVVRVRYTPTKPGEAKGKLVITSNDPDSPQFQYDLDGNAVLPPDTADPAPTSTTKKPPKNTGGAGSVEEDPEEEGGPAVSAAPSSDGGCGCRTAPSPAAPGGSAAALLLGLALLRRSRPSRPRRLARSQENHHEIIPSPVSCLAGRSSCARAARRGLPGSRRRPAPLRVPR